MQHIETEIPVGFTPFAVSIKIGSGDDAIDIYSLFNSVVQAVKMPERYMVEMVADWIGAGIAITGEMEVWEWYKANRNNMTLHPETRNEVEMLLRWTKIVHNKEEIKDRIYERN